MVVMVPVVSHLPHQAHLLKSRTLKQVSRDATLVTKPLSLSAANNGPRCAVSSPSCNNTRFDNSVHDPWSSNVVRTQGCCSSSIVDVFVDEINAKSTQADRAVLPSLRSHVNAHKRLCRILQRLDKLPVQKNSRVLFKRFHSSNNNKLLMVCVEGDCRLNMKNSMIEMKAKTPTVSEVIQWLGDATSRIQLHHTANKPSQVIVDYFPIVEELQKILGPDIVVSCL